MGLAEQYFRLRHTPKGRVRQVTATRIKATTRMERWKECLCIPCLEPFEQVIYNPGSPYAALISLSKIDNLC